jgi:hypothetical protein
MFNILADVWAKNGFLQLFAVVLFGALIPVFSGLSVWGIRRTATGRRGGLLSAFPTLTNTIYYQLYINGDNRSVSTVKASRYLTPIVFIFLLNTFMSIVLLDFMRLTDDLISPTVRVYILCGGHCADDSDQVVYQTQTLVAMAYAFLGWMVWTFGTIFDRASALQLFPSTFNRLLIRLVIAILVAAVARHLVDAAPDIAEFSGIPVLSFVIGMFPERGIKLITSTFEKWFRSSRHSEDFNLELIEGISPGMTYRLEEIAIESGASLTCANPFAIFDASVTPMSEIVDWIAQAHLLLLLKADRFQAMQKIGCRTIFDLLRLIKGPSGVASLRTLCNLDLPQDYDLAAALQADCDYKRLREVYVAIGNDAP